jgi:ubiquinone/menaquinone biosynthesis C-methylase UbiE
MTYLDTAHRLYADAARTVRRSLCCTPGPRFQLPGLVIPERMQAMDYGCGTTVHLRDLSPGLDVLYIGVGGGLEALQFAYFTRRPGSVLAVDRVPEMLAVAAEHLAEAAALNPWFRRDMIELIEGDALSLPLPDARVDLVAQNCLFNIFTPEDLDRALAEVARVLRPGGRLVLSDPVCEQPLPEALRQDERLRAECLSGALPLDAYLERIVQAGFGTLEVRARRPYRVLDRRRFGTPTDVLLETVEIAAIKGAVPEDGACVFAGETAIYIGDDEAFDDHLGHRLERDIPLAVCRKTAAALQRLGRTDLVVTEPHWHHAGGGCC